MLDPAVLVRVAFPPIGIRLVCASVPDSKGLPSKVQVSDGAVIEDIVTEVLSTPYTIRNFVPSFPTEALKVLNPGSTVTVVLLVEILAVTPA